MRTLSPIRILPFWLYITKRSGKLQPLPISMLPLLTKTVAPGSLLLLLKAKLLSASRYVKCLLKPSLIATSAVISLAALLKKNLTSGSFTSSVLACLYTACWGKYSKPVAVLLAKAYFPASSRWLAANFKVSWHSRCTALPRLVAVPCTCKKLIRPSLLSTLFATISTGSLPGCKAPAKHWYCPGVRELSFKLKKNELFSCLSCCSSSLCFVFASSRWLHSKAMCANIAISNATNNK